MGSVKKEVLRLLDISSIYPDERKVRGNAYYTFQLQTSSATPEKVISFKVVNMRHS